MEALLEHAERERRGDPAELAPVLAYVAEARFDPDARERVRGAIRDLLPGRRDAPPLTVHHARHVPADGEYPDGTSEERYEQSGAEVCRDPRAGALPYRRFGQLELDVIAPTPAWVRAIPTAGPLTLVGYAANFGHRTTLHQPEGGLRSVYENPTEEERVSRGEDDPRTEPEREPITEQRPIWPSGRDLDRWKALPPQERFKDPEYQRYAQSFRTRESLSRSGKQGYNATVGKYGAEFLHDRAADKRREREVPHSRVERRMMTMLEELGEREDRTEYGGQSGTYLREHRLAPRRYADFAWPDKHKAIEAWGGVHTNEFFVRQDRVQQANQRQIDRARRAGWQLMVVTAEELQRDNRDTTRERVRQFLR